jgi:PAT family beta-lactamase induction signal transducer AmpG
MGLSNSTFGLYAGFVSFPLPQLLASQHVPEAQIASITATVFSPFFWSFLLSPVLDVRFSRRLYATVLDGAAATALAVAILNLHHLMVLQWALAAGTMAAAMASNALGGWLVGVIPHEEETTLSSWFNVATVGAGGVMALFAAETIHHLPVALAALLLGLAVFLPTTIFLWIPAPGPDRRLARESFLGFFGTVLSLLRRGPILIALMLFLAPASCFALTNILGGLGSSFAAPERIVSLLGGLGVTAAGVFGSLIFPVFGKRMPLRPLYLLIGVAGSLFTLALVPLHHTPVTFGVALIGENVFQSLAFTAAFAIAFETIGQNNPLASTTFSLLIASSNLPLIYMQVWDGRGFAWRGVTGAYVADAVMSIVACAVLGVVLAVVRGREKAPADFLQE